MVLQHSLRTYGIRTTIYQSTFTIRSKLSLTSSVTKARTGPPGKQARRLQCQILDITETNFLSNYAANFLSNTEISNSPTCYKVAPGLEHHLCPCKLITLFHPFLTPFSPADSFVCQGLLSDPDLSLARVKIFHSFAF